MPSSRSCCNKKGVPNADIILPAYRRNGSHLGPVKGELPAGGRGIDHPLHARLSSSAHRVSRYLEWIMGALTCSNLEGCRRKNPRIFATKSNEPHKADASRAAKRLAAALRVRCVSKFPSLAADISVMLARGSAWDFTRRISQYWSRRSQNLRSLTFRPPTYALPGWRLQFCHPISRSFHGRLVGKQQTVETQSSTILQRYKAKCMCRLLPQCILDLAYAIRCRPILIFKS